MTSEYTGLTTWGDIPPENLLRDASCLLWDFDGPLCRLFAGHPARDIVVTLCDMLGDLGMGALAAQWSGTGDPLQILRSEHVEGVVSLLERRMAAEETEAASKAEPTAGAAEFAQAMVERGRLLAITSNNAPGAIGTYLRAHGLDELFGSSIFGRRADAPKLMKPDPDCLVRAMDTLGVSPEECLMIGDSVMDAKAARAAGVAFLGYARNAERVDRLRVDARVANGVIGMEPLIAAAAKVNAVPRLPGRGAS